MLSFEDLAPESLNTETNTSSMSTHIMPSSENNTGKLLAKKVQKNSKTKGGLPKDLPKWITGDSRVC